MKSEIHPDYHLVKVIMTDGSEFTTRTTWGESGDTLHLDVDPKSHPAWTGGQQHLVDRGGRARTSRKSFPAFLRSRRSRRVQTPSRSKAAFKSPSCLSTGLPTAILSGTGACIVVSSRRTSACSLVERTISS